MHRSSRPEAVPRASGRLEQTVQMSVVAVCVVKRPCDQVLWSRILLWEGKMDVPATWEAAHVWQRLLPQDKGSHRVCDRSRVVRYCIIHCCLGAATEHKLPIVSLFTAKFQKSSASRLNACIGHRKSRQSCQAPIIILGVCTSFSFINPDYRFVQSIAASFSTRQGTIMFPFYDAIGSWPKARGRKSDHSFRLRRFLCECC